MLERQTRTLKYADGPIAIIEEDDKLLYENVQCISICDSGMDACLSKVELIILSWNSTYKACLCSLVSCYWFPSSIDQMKFVLH